MEVNQAAEIIKETAHPDVNLIFGAVIDESLGDNLRITVIATGFEGNSINTRREAKVEHKQNTYAKQRPLPSMEEQEKKDNNGYEPRRDAYEFPTRINTDDLDVPAFLRKRNQN
jgi:cell division protein FtsZ